MGIDPLIGQPLGAYLIQSKLGEGGMARVYKGYHARLRRDVAIKVVLSSYTEDHEDFRARFEREAQLIASLEHPNIVSVYDFGEIDTHMYLIMQYVGGGTLRDQLRSGQPLDPRRAANYAIQMARALHHAHEHGIVHRDVKPQNMLVSSNDAEHLLLSDFGIAKLFGSDSDTGKSGSISPNLPRDPALTAVDQIVGTAEYMAPEQIQKKHIDARTDVYSLGVVLYQMLTGQTLFKTNTVIELLYRHVTTVPKPAREVNPNVPEVLAQITAKALEKAPEKRFQSAQEMALALEAALAPKTTILPNNTFASYPAMNQFSAKSQALPSQSLGRVPTTGPGSYQQSMGRMPVAGPGNYSQQLNAASPVGIPEQVITREPAYPRYPTPPVTGDIIPRNTSAYYTPGPPSMAPTRPRSSWMVRLLPVVAVLLVVATIGFIAVKTLFPSGGQPATNHGPAAAFTDTFQNNNLHWAEGNLNGLTASVKDNKYTLTTDGSNTIHFPYPASVGVLPMQFTLTAQIRQVAGDQNTFYGVVWRLTYQGNQTKGYYAFVITGNGRFEILRYDAGNAGLTVLWQGHSNYINDHTQTNTLKVIAQGTRYQFRVNDQPLMGNDKTISDNTYTAGQLALLISGPDTSFTVNQVQLALS